MNELSVSRFTPSFVFGEAPKVLFVHHKNNGSLNLAQETISAVFCQPKIDFVETMAAALKIVDMERYDVIFIEGDLGNDESGDMVARALRTKDVAAPLIGFCVALSEAQRQAFLGSGMADVIMLDKLETFLRQHVLEANIAVPRQLILNDKPRVLIIDDRPEDFKIVMAKEVVLEVFPNAQIIVVETGEAGLEELKVNEHDLVLIDYNLGTRTVGGDEKVFVYGDEVAKLLRKANIQTHLVGFSFDMSNVAKKEKCLRAGMDDAITPNELCQFLEASKNVATQG